MENRYITEIRDARHHHGYDFMYTVSLDVENTIDNCSHAHEDFYELVFILTGDTQYHIEGNIYKMDPHDIFITRPGELHRIYFLSSQKYERIVLFIMKDFFTKNHCEELENFFLNHKPGINCHIPARLVTKEMQSLLLKMNRYLQDNAPNIADCVLQEFLYLINHIREPLTEPIIEDVRIQKILLYINEHLDEELNLDTLSDIFYINKYHLCRLFKAITGHTINQYINYKRLIRVSELCAQGQSLLEASMNAGFNTYSHFYKAYKKTFGTSPKDTLLTKKKSEEHT